jgi:hypothetical protein
MLFSIHQYSATKKVTASQSLVVNGTTGLQVFYLDTAPILNSNGDGVGRLGDSSVTGIEPTFGNKEVPLKTAHQFAGQKGSEPGPVNPGEYALDYNNGVLYIVPLVGGTLNFSCKVRAILTTT